MKRKVINKKTVHILLTIFALVLVSITLIEVLRQYTDWPVVKLTLSDKQKEWYGSVSVYRYFPKYFPHALFYFTKWTNIAIYPTMLYSFARRKTIAFEWKIALMIMATMTCFVFVFLIAPYLPWGQSAWFDFIYIHEHIDLFIITSTWFALSIGKQETRRINTAVTSLFIPATYLLWSVFIYGTTQGKAAVYAFLDFQRPFGYSGNNILGIFITIAFLLFMSVLIYYLSVYLCKLNNRLYDKRKLKQINNNPQ